MTCGYATTIATTLYLHRSRTHHGLALHPVVAIPMRLWLCLTTSGTTAGWTGAHWKHHERADRPGDPYSPNVEGGLWKFLRNWLGVGFYSDAIRDGTLAARHGNPEDDWLERHFLEPHRSWGIWLFLVIDFALFGWWGFPIWLVQIAWIPLWSSAVINGLGHWWGTRPYDTPDMSRNIHVLTWPLLTFFAGFLTGGEEWHNHHHDDPSNAIFSRRWWQIDHGAFWIKILCLLRLAEITPRGRGKRARQLAAV